MNKKYSIVFLWILLTVISLGMTNAAKSQNAFPCDGKLYFFGDSSGIGMLSYIDNYPLFPVAHNVCVMQLTNYNAMAANPLDHYIYYQNNSNLYKMDNHCNNTLVCSAFSGTVEACFDNLGRYWYVDGGTINRLDLSTCTITPIGSVPSGNGVCLDFAFNPNDCSFYWVGADSIYQVDSMGVITNTRAGGFGAIANNATFGGVAMGYDNYFYGMTNGSAMLYQVNLTTGASDSLYQVPTGNTGYDMASFLCNPIAAIALATPDSGCPGVTVHFTDTSTGTGNIRLWHFGDSRSGANDTSTLKHPNHTYDTSGLYTVSLVIRTGPGNMCIPAGFDSISFTVYVYNLPLPIAGPDQTICRGDSIALQGSGSGHFLWSPANTLLCDTCHHPIVFPTVSTNYILTFTDSATGCVNTDTTRVIVNPLPAAPIVTVIGSIYLICPGDSVQLMATQITHDSLLWSPAITLSCDSCPSPFAYPTTNTTYYLQVTDSTTGCSSIGYATVTLKVAPNVSVSPGSTICKGDTTHINGIGSGTLYWSPTTGLSCGNCTNPTANPTVTTSYVLLVTDTINHCTSRDTVIIVVNPLPSITLQYLDSICRGDSINLNASGLGNYHWAWTPSSGLNCPTCPNPQASPSNTTNYHLLITDAVTGCFIHDSAKVVVSPLPPISILADTTICDGDTLKLQATGGTSYLWNTGDIASIIYKSPAQSTLYSVLGSDGICHHQDSVFVRWLANPKPSIMDTTICSGKSITLTASGRADILWYDFSNLISPIHSGFTFTTPHITGTTIYYIASDSGQCHSRLIPFTITVEDCPIFVPNVFTPNADGHNDKFTINAKGLASIHVRIYNRWGMFLYEWNTIDGGWDGTLGSGAKAPDGVYYFVADMVDFYGTFKAQTGYIELINK